MLHNISWESYWTFIGVTTLAYYLVVWLTCFRKSFGLKAIFSPGNLHNGEQPPSLADQTMNLNGEHEESIVHACMDELNAFFENQKRSKPLKSELIYGLYAILQKYPSLKHSDYRHSLTNVLATQCENICSIHLSAEEMKGVWFG